MMPPPTDTITQQEVSDKLIQIFNHLHLHSSIHISFKALALRHVFTHTKFHSPPYTGDNDETSDDDDPEAKPTLARTLATTFLAEYSEKLWPNSPLDRKIYSGPSCLDMGTVGEHLQNVLSRYIWKLLEIKAEHEVLASVIKAIEVERVRYEAAVVESEAAAVESEATVANVSVPGVSVPEVPGSFPTENVDAVAAGLEGMELEEGDELGDDDSVSDEESEVDEKLHYCEIGLEGSPGAAEVICGEEFESQEGPCDASGEGALLRVCAVRL